ncbi:MotA/TolQ/ExbB proton channel family protein [Methylibium sp.]|jgi:biopolymer transport protein ExbB|uniref:MotA/TolQ/ExbB proton channel family protein n=1 Tax=Methylibium sp. TaxID=2067992 RepID=UPI003D0AFE9E
MVRRFVLRSVLALATAVAGIALTGVALVPSPVQAQAPAASEPVAPTAVVPAPAAPAPTAVVENPYGLESLWRTSDGVAKAVLLILVVMSMGSWYIIVVKFIEQAKLNRQARLAAKSFWSAGSVRQGADTLESTSPFRFIAEAGLEATKKHGGLFEHVDLNSWVTMSIQRAMERVQSRLQDGLAFLATVGSTAPFVGLFGTVWGIYHALTAIGVAGQASIDKVAGPVGEALIMTAIGLAVAVPAVLGYNWLVRRNKGSMEEVRAFGNDLHSVLLATSRGPAKA